MKQILLLLLMLLMAGTAFGEDLRIASQQAKADYEAALAEAQKSRQRILEDKNLLKTEIDRSQNSIAVLKSDIAEFERVLSELKNTETTQIQAQTEDRMDMREYTGVVREVARDLESILSQSLFTAQKPDRLDRLAPALAKDRFPGIAEIDIISELFFEEMALSGEIDLRTGTYLDPGGAETTGDVLTIGNFCAVYQKDGRSGFLRYGEGGKRLFALSTQPPWLMRRNLDQYIRGESDDVYFDFSRGAALKQIAHRVTFVDQVKKGGIIVWPILGLGLLALIITLERFIFLNRVHANTDRVMSKVNHLAGQGDWAGCDAVLQHQKGKPVYNVLRAGLGAVNEKRETLESVLQEAILKELPRLERLLPALNIMGAVAPLLGLLGTVTGMIATFHVITLYGSGDPRMMSGGISEALVTTMLGLSIAIPIMLAHTFLRRRVEHIIGDMEEKAVALSNIICRECTLVALPTGDAVLSKTTMLKAGA
jgi:biopolymer transport protein ExbB